MMCCKITQGTQKCTTRYAKPFLDILQQLVIMKHKNIYPKFRSSHRRCSVKKGVLRNFAKFTGKHLCQSFFFNKVLATLLKKRLWHRCFPVNFAKFLRAPFLQNTSRRLLLQILLWGLHQSFLLPKL